MYLGIINEPHFERNKYATTRVITYFFEFSEDLKRVHFLNLKLFNLASNKNFQRDKKNFIKSHVRHYTFNFFFNI